MLLLFQRPNLGTGVARASLEMNYIYYIIVDSIAITVLLIATFAAMLFALFAVKQAMCTTAVQPIGMKKRKSKMYNFQLNFAKAFLGDWVLDTEENDDGTTFILLFKTRFPDWTLLMVSANLMIMLVYIAAVFFNAFLIERTTDCTSTFFDPGFNCFIRDDTVFIPSINCSDVDYEKHDIICLKFTMNFPFAAGLTGGLLEFFPLLFTIPLYTIIKVSNGSKFRMYIAYALQWFLLVIVMVLGIALFLIKYVRQYVIGNDIYDFFTYASLFAILLSVLIMPWSLTIQPKIRDKLDINRNHSPDYYIHRAEEGLDDNSVLELEKK